VFLGLGLPEWILIAALVGGLWVTFKVMARASVAYERARKAREAKQDIKDIEEEG
jgi:hypothetical protein